mgnify:CR=1 FL=1
MPSLSEETGGRVSMLMPGSTIGIIGGGQLGRMMALSARYMGFRVGVLDPTPNCPTGQVADFQITLAMGRPELYPEQPTTVRGFKPQIDEADWLLTQVVHDLTNQGYTNRLQLEVKLEELPE